LCLYAVVVLLGVRAGGFMGGLQVGVIGTLAMFRLGLGVLDRYGRARGAK